ncbi:GTPase-associated system all-helical protein GASH [Methylovulum psychrotolerans]|uniref:GTPase-associated system helical domain-containing protein n=1 Tax=Methylovulum psychrotolerans TaxID=1704499 RepID=A0A1Z4BYP5_9GAMM|nr:GTPase-associated system all-helical protein GASH [Methylovulum psychrotolerans]ASF46379.1 hypothetical protein CEK71_09990 [Methylovulum psychrotolerans]
MTDLLTQLLNAGLIDKLDGNDDRFTKMEKAAEAIAQELREQPPLLIRAILAALDPNIPPDDPAIVQAEQALIGQWPTMRSVHTDRPVNLLRAILLEACNQATDDYTKVAILWLTVANTLPMLRLGKEEAVVLQMLEVWARRSEENALIGLTTPSKNYLQATIGKLEPIELTTHELYKVDQDSLINTIRTSFSNNSYHGVQYNGFHENMAHILTTEINGCSEALHDGLHESQTETNQQLQNNLIELSESVNKALTSQQHWVIKTQQAGQICLNALWWSEALYSSSLTCSYRELPQAIATVVMAIDLLNEVTKPTPASVGYLLAEAVNRLPEAGFDRKLTLQDLLAALAKNRTKLPKTWLETFIPPPEIGRLSLRDLVVLVLANPTFDIAAAIKRTGASGEFELSLPKFAHALFRQEQAVQLAGSIQ